MYKRYRNGKAAYKNKENGIAIILVTVMLLLFRMMVMLILHIIIPYGL
jgi:hypothetical protein